MQHYDLLIVGAGNAGLKAAIAAHKADSSLKILLVTKKTLGTGGVSAYAAADRAIYHTTLDYTLPISPDSWKYHAADIYRGGMKVSKPELAEILAKNSAKSFYYLVDKGVKFAKKGERFEQILTDGSVYARGCYTGPDTVQKVHRTLLREFKALGIDYMEHCMVAQLVRSGALLSSAVIFDEKSKSFSTLSFNACILATGGACNLYADNATPSGVNGDGYVLAHAAGADLVNMEFIRFATISLSTNIGLSGSFYRAIPRIINEKDEEIIYKYLPGSFNQGAIFSTIFSKGANWALSAESLSKYIDLAIYKERARGHKVYLDLMNNPDNFHFERSLSDNIKKAYASEIKESEGSNRLNAPIFRLKELNPGIVAYFRQNGLDLESEPLEISLSAQHCMGGVLIDKDARSTVRNLFAAGECAGAQHGANITGGSGLLDTQVFGEIAGINAAAQAKQAVNIDTDALESALLKNKAQGRDIKKTTAIKSAVQKIMQRAFAAVRVKSQMQDAFEYLKDLDHKSTQLDFEGRSVLKLAQIVAHFCLKREESRGSHLLFSNEKDIEPLPSAGINHEQSSILRGKHD